MYTRPTIALQLYTLRHLTSHDMRGVLKEVAAIGYEGVETAGYGNLDAAEMHATLQEYGLKVVGILSNLIELQTDLERVISDALLLDTRYVTCPYLAPDRRSEAGYIAIGRELDGYGAQLRESGLQMCYHNHAFEFERFGNRSGMDLIYGNSSPENLHAELDTYWVKSGGEDVAAYITRFSKRLPLLHIKDMAADAQGSFAEVGAGTLPWTAIFEAAEQAGVTAYIVEQDECAGDPLESVRLSLENLRRFGKLPSMTTA